MPPPITTLTASGLASDLALLLQPCWLAGKSPEDSARNLVSVLDNLVELKLQERECLALRDSLLTADQAARLIGIDANWVRRLARAKKLTSYREPGTRRHAFRHGEVIDWYQANIRPDNEVKGARKRSGPAVTKKTVK